MKRDLWIAVAAMAAGIAVGLLVLALRAEPEPQKEITWPALAPP